MVLKVLRWFGLTAALLCLAAWPQGAASSCEWTDVERIVAVGDVHGAYDRYTEILRTANVIDAKGRWAGGTTHLVQLGDVVDRGPDSRKALDLIQRLEGEAAKARGAVHMLLGNHEVMRMLGDVRYVSPGEYAAFRSAGSDDVRDRYVQAAAATPEDRERLKRETPLGFVEMLQAFRREGPYGKWLRQLPAVIKINGYVFLHGGISPTVAPLGCEAINDRIRRELTTDFDKLRAAPLESLAAREDGPLWYRGLAQEPDTFAPQVDDILSRLGARAIVIAHTPTDTFRVRERFGGKVIQLDTGMQAAYAPNGRASALEIAHGLITAIYVDRRDTLGTR